MVDKVLEFFQELLRGRSVVVWVSLHSPQHGLYVFRFVVLVVGELRGKGVDGLARCPVFIHQHGNTAAVHASAQLCPHGYIAAQVQAHAFVEDLRKLPHGFCGILQGR